MIWSSSFKKSGLKFCRKSRPKKRRLCYIFFMAIRESYIFTISLPIYIWNGGTWQQKGGKKIN